MINTMEEQRTAREFKLTATINEMPVAKITSSIDAINYVRKFYNDDIAIYESAFILLIDRANNTIGWAKISQGGICGTVVDIRIVAKYAIEALASSVIFVHNHPSGNVNPSVDDINIVQKLKVGLAVLDVKLLDSIIICQDEKKSYSFKDEGRL